MAKTIEPGTYRIFVTAKDICGAKRECPENCPLARRLKRRFPGFRIRVGAIKGRLSIGSRSFKFTPSMNKFVCIVDRLRSVVEPCWIVLVVPPVKPRKSSGTRKPRSPVTRPVKVKTPGRTK